MRVLWLCNSSPLNNNPKESGGWYSSMAQHLLERDIRIVYVFPAEKKERFFPSEYGTCYFTFEQAKIGKPDQIQPGLQGYFCDILKEVNPDVIHIWGTEYAHALSMVLAAEEVQTICRVVVHIQGFCFACSDVMENSLPFSTVFRTLPRDLILGNVRMLRRQFERRGKNEQEILRRIHYVMGRTSWDRAISTLINPKLQYLHCGELLRKPFYEGCWTYETCIPNTIFVSQAAYPIKGFHLLLHALKDVVTHCPEVEVYISGKDVTKQGGGIKNRASLSGYGYYIRQLIRKYGIERNVHFIGPQDSDGMKAMYLKANIFVQPSLIENSPNSLGEAMYIGTPCIASYVGGVPDFIENGISGFLYPVEDFRQLAAQICQLLRNPELAKQVSANARNFAQDRFNEEKTINELLSCYRRIEIENNCEMN